MRSRLGIWTALAVTLTAAGPRAEAAPPRTVCEQRCLGGYVDKVLRAMMDHDPSRAPLAPDVRYTENGEAVKPGAGLWATASALAIEDDGLSSLGRQSSAYRLYFADPASGQAAYFGAFTENGAPGMMMLRLRAVAGRVAEIETVIVRKEAAQAGDLAPPAFDPKGFDEPEPALLAGGERWAPNIMTAAANRYFDGMEKSSSLGVPLGADCVRRDNGVRAELGCAAQLDGGVFRSVSQVRRRVVVVDEDRGLVMAVALVDHGPPASAPKKKKKPKQPVVPAAAITPSTELAGAIFKMSEGKITRIETLERPVPYGMASVWTQAAGA